MITSSLQKSIPRKHTFVNTTNKKKKDKEISPNQSYRIIKTSQTTKFRQEQSKFIAETSKPYIKSSLAQNKSFSLKAF